MEAKKLKYNELPVITFRWVRANDLRLAEVEPDGAVYSRAHVVSGQELLRPFDEIRIEEWLGSYPGTNETELARVLNEASVTHYIQSSAAGEMVRFHYDLSGAEHSLLELNVIEVQANESLNVLMEYVGDETATLASVLNLIRVAPGGVLNLYKINHLPTGARHIEQRYAKVAEGGTVNYYSIELGARETIVHYLTDLAGDESQGHLKSIYVGHESRIIDLSHQMSHWGRKSRCDMEIRGALTDRARKYFRGTLDFKRGSAQSEGGEVETVMLLNKDVKSFAIPLLLCGEDDVIGNHAASAGQIDEDKLFYLMSRGFSHEESKRIIVESAFRPIIDQMPDEALRQRILDRIAMMMKKVNS